MSVSIAPAQNTGVIEGSAVDAITNKAVAGAVIIASKTSQVPARRVATSTFDGTFQISSLPAGSYDICVQIPRGGYLPTCNWGIPATSVAVKDSQRIIGNKITLQPASTLTIHINDPNQLLTKKTKQGHSPHLMMGVWNANAFYPARLVSASVNSADYQVAIPFDTSLRFLIQSATFVLSDVHGSVLAAAGDQQTLIHSSVNTNNTTLSYTIAGTKP